MPPKPKPKVSNEETNSTAPDEESNEELVGPPLPPTQTTTTEESIDPKKSIDFEKIGMFGAQMKYLITEDTEKDDGNDEGGLGKFGKITTATKLPSKQCKHRWVIPKVSNEETNSTAPDEESNEELVGPPLPPTQTTTEDDSSFIPEPTSDVEPDEESDEELVGPPQSENCAFLFLVCLFRKVKSFLGSFQTIA